MRSPVPGLDLKLAARSGGPRGVAPRRRLGLLFIFSGLLGLSASAGTVPDQLGKVLRVERNDRSASVRAEGGSVRIEFVGPDIARITASRSGVFPADTTHAEFNGPYHIADYDRQPIPLNARQDGTGWRFEPAGRARCAVEIATSPFRLRFVRVGQDPAQGREEAPLLEETLGGGFQFSEGRTEARFLIRESEHFIGFGAHRHPLDLRGQAMEFASSELGEAGQGGGFPVPWMMSSRGYGLFLNNVDPTTRFDLGKTRGGELVIDAADGGREGWNFDLYLIVGDSYPDLMRGYIRLTGKPILAEKWFFGNMQSKCCDWQADDVVYIASRFHRLGLPLDAMILDLQWREMRPDMWEWTPAFDHLAHAGKKHNLTWSPSLGDVPAMFQALDKLQVKLGLHENTTSTYSNDAAGAGPYLDQAFPDLSDPAVAARLWRMHERLLADGADFWWQDQGERIRATGVNGYPMQNLNGALWAKLVVEGIRREYQVSVPVLSRSGPVGGHRSISPWPGDVPAGLPFLTFDLDYIRNGGLAGYATIGADLGGFYHGKTPDPENEIRRICDMLLVFPVIRTHGTYYKLPWMFSSEAQSIYANHLQLRYRLLPYLYSAAIEAHETGRPILAPLCFDHGDDEATYRRDFDFLVGRDLLVAPVVESAETRDVYLPAGRWRDFWSDQAYAGNGLVKVAAPLKSERSLPMFVREGAILPMIAPALTIPSGLFARYTFHLYPTPGQEEQRVFRDRAHALGESSTVTVRMTDSPGQLDVRVEGVNHLETLYFHGVARPTAVIVDDAALPEKTGDLAESGWTYGPSDFPLQKETVVLKIRLPRAALANARPVSCTVRK